MTNKKQPEVIDKMNKEEKKKDMIVKPEMNVESLISTAIKQGTSVETMEKILAMRKELKSEIAEQKFNQAMAKLQKEIPIIKKNKKVLNKDKRSVRYRYATMDSIVEQLQGIISKHGFSYRLRAHVEGDWVTAVCKVTHAEGHTENSSFKAPIEKGAYMNEAQKFASALTFAKRYAFCNAFGIMTGDDDDDAQATGQPESQQQRAQENVKVDKKGKPQTNKKITEKQKGLLYGLLDKAGFKKAEGRKKWEEKIGKKIDELDIFEASNWIRKYQEKFNGDN